MDRKREDSTHALYAYHLNRTILPALGALQLRECTVARLDAFLEALEPRYAAATRRTPFGNDRVVAGFVAAAAAQQTRSASRARACNA